jgi:hypothetical protein
MNQPGGLVHGGEAGSDIFRITLRSTHEMMIIQIALAYVSMAALRLSHCNADMSHTIVMAAVCTAHATTY